MISINSISLMN